MLPDNNTFLIKQFSPRVVNGALLGVMLLIYHQIFYTDYVYTDEAFQLWNNQDNTNFLVFYEHGRAITGYLFQGLFSAAHSINDLKWIRLFSFGGWLLSAVIWFVIIDALQKKLRLPWNVTFLIKLFLITSLPVGIYIGWASCLQLFIACTAGFLSGYFLLAAVDEKEQITLSFGRILAIFLLGLTSLFTYQTSFCCFLLPFLFYYFYHEEPRLNKTLVIAVGCYLACFVVYYMLFKYSLKIEGIEAAGRTDLSFNLFRKLKFIYTTAIKRAAGFNFIHNRHNPVSRFGVPILWVLFLVVYFKNRTSQKWSKTLAGSLPLLPLPVLLYLPLLVVQEDFPSYRTLFALNIGLVLFFLVEFNTLFSKLGVAKVFVAGMGVLFVGMAYYNFNYGFVNPIAKEYAALKAFTNQKLSPHVKTIHLVRPHEKFYEELYPLYNYQDEYGLPSTFMPWTPEPLLKQMYTDKFRDRQKASQLTITSSEKDAPLPALPPGTLLIDMEEIILKYKP